MAHEDIASYLAADHEKEIVIGYRKATHQEIIDRRTCQNCNFIAGTADQVEVAKCEEGIFYHAYHTCDRFQKWYKKDVGAPHAAPILPEHERSISTEEYLETARKNGGFSK